MDLIRCLPERLRAEAVEAGVPNVWQFRLRAGRPLTAQSARGTYTGRLCVTAEEMKRCADALTGHGLQSLSLQVSQGFAPLEGGHRLGLGGSFSDGRLTQVSSLCVRVAHEIKTAGEAVFPQLFENGALKTSLILGAPGTGKTTLLRDLVRRLSEQNVNVGVADERGEIAALYQGVPQLDVGANTDVIEGMKKAQALLMLARTMCPQALAADELGQEEEIRAVRVASSLGVPLLLSAHAAGAGDVRRRGLDGLIEEGVIERVVYLPKIGKAVVMEGKAWISSN